MRHIFAAALATTCALPALAQDRPNTILVMDGSGSMWGQIDGIAKITIAQDVVADLVGTIPADQGLGLTVYGHRERGNCTDIETVVAPAAGTGDAIVAAVRGIKPLGKTPMTDAIIAAAEALRYTEERATVILVSDGVETCNPDPCAAARLLEEAGVDFTAHVVGFDVGSDPDALAQMQCIASETGGDFLTADNAAELGAALTAVVQEPEPMITSLTFEARLGDENGPLVEDQILWTVDGAFESEPGNPFITDLIAGSYTISGYRIQEEFEVLQSIDLVANEQTAVLVFPEPVEQALLTGPDTAVLGSTITIGWDGPNDANDYIGVGKVGATGAGAWDNFAYTVDGNPSTLLMPPAEGDYQIGYFKGSNREVIGVMPITLTPVDITITAPTEAVAGDDITVDWTGPNYADGYIGIGKVGANGAGGWENFAYTEAGNPAIVTVPTEPGDYLITYFVAQDRVPMMSKPITVTKAGASVTAPAEAVAGSEISVSWSGPGYDDDYVGIGKVSANGAAQWQNFVYVRDLSEGTLLMPPEPGDYVISYFLAQDRTMVTSTSITLTKIEADVTAPSSAPIGSTIFVQWRGPDYADDYIGIGPVGTSGAGQWQNFRYTRDGAPAELMVPPVAGDYVIQYFAAQNRQPITSTPITVTDLKVQILTENAAAAGTDLVIAWDGPDYADDYIGIGKLGASGSSQWETYADTKNGNPSTVKVPDEPGDYLVQYFMAQDRISIGTRQLTVE